MIINLYVLYNVINKYYCKMNTDKIKEANRILEALIENCSENDTNTPIEISDFIDIVRPLIKLGANPNTICKKNGKTILFSIVDLGDLNTLDEFVNLGCDPNVGNDYYGTCKLLDYAIDKRSYEIVDWLLSNSVDVDEKLTYYDQKYKQNITYTRLHRLIYLLLNTTDSQIVNHIIKTIDIFMKHNPNLTLHGTCLYKGKLTDLIKNIPVKYTTDWPNYHNIVKKVDQIKNTLNTGLISQIDGFMDSSEYIYDLILKGADPNITGSDGKTILMKLARLHNVEIIRKFVNIGCNKFSVDSNNFMPIHYAIIEFNTPVIEWFLDNGCDINITIFNKCVLKYICKEALTCVISQEDAIEISKLFIDRGYDLLKKNKNGETLITMFKSWKNYYQYEIKWKQLVEYLCHETEKQLQKYKQEMNKKLEQLEWTYPNNALQIAKELIKNGADPNIIIIDSTVLVETIINSKYIPNVFDEIKELIQLGCDVNFKFRGWDALSYAAGFGKVDIALLLLENGANISSVNALFICERVKQLAYSQETAIELLQKLYIDRGYELNIDILSYDKDKCDTVNEPVVDYIVKHYANLDKVTSFLKKYVNDNLDKQLLKLLDPDTFFENIVKVVDLIKQGANPNIFNEDFVSPLFLVARYMNPENVAQFVNMGCDIHAMNKAGDKAIDYAIKGGNLLVIEWFLENGIDANESIITPISHKSRLYNIILNCCESYFTIEKAQEMISLFFTKNIRLNHSECDKLIEYFNSKYINNVHQLNNLRLIQELLKTITNIEIEIQLDDQKPKTMNDRLIEIINMDTNEQYIYDEAYELVELITGDNSTNEYGVTVFMKVCQYCDLQTVQKFAKHFNVLQQDDNEYDALDYALYNKKYETAKWLLDNYININQKYGYNKYGCWTRLARYYNNLGYQREATVETILFLLDNGADPSISGTIEYDGSVLDYLKYDITYYDLIKNNIPDYKVSLLDLQTISNYIDFLNQSSFNKKLEIKETFEKLYINGYILLNKILKHINQSYYHESNNIYITNYCNHLKSRLSVYFTDKQSSDLVYDLCNKLKEYTNLEQINEDIIVIMIKLYDKINFNIAYKMKFIEKIFISC